MDARLPERGERWEEGWEEEEKVKIAADKKEEVNIKEERENKEKRCELKGGRERESGRNPEEKKGRGYRETILVCTTLILGAKIDVKASNGLYFCSSALFLPPPTTPILRDHHRDAGGLYDSSACIHQFDLITCWQWRNLICWAFTQSHSG